MLTRTKNCPNKSCAPHRFVWRFAIHHMHAGLQDDHCPQFEHYQYNYVPTKTRSKPKVWGLGFRDRVSKEVEGWNMNVMHITYFGHDQIFCELRELHLCAHQGTQMDLGRQLLLPLWGRVQDTEIRLPWAISSLLLDRLEVSLNESLRRQ